MPVWAARMAISGVISKSTKAWNWWWLLRGAATACKSLRRTGVHTTPTARNAALPAHTPGGSNGVVAVIPVAVAVVLVSPLIRSVFVRFIYIVRIRSAAFIASTKDRRGGVCIVVVVVVDAAAEAVTAAVFSLLASSLSLPLLLLIIVVVAAAVVSSKTNSIVALLIFAEEQSQSLSLSRAGNFWLFPLQNLSSTPPPLFPILIVQNNSPTEYDLGEGNSKFNPGFRTWCANQN